MTDWAWPWDGIQYWLEELWNWVSEASFYSAEWLWNEILESFTWLSNFITESVAWIWDRIEPYLGPVASWIEKAANWAWEALFDFVRDPIGALKDGWRTAISVVSNWIGDLWATVDNAIGNARRRIQDYLESLWTSLADGFKDVSRDIDQGVEDLWTSLNTNMDNFRTYLEVNIGGLWDSMVGLASDLLNGVAEALGTGLQGAIDWVLKHLTYLAQMIFGVVDTVVSAVKGFISSFVRQFTNTLTDAFSPGSPDEEIHHDLQIMIATMNQRVEKEIKEMYQSPARIEDVVRVAGTVAALLGVGIISVKVLASAADLAHPLKDIGFKDIATTMIAGTGAAMTMSTLIRLPTEVGLITPLRYAYNRLFTPNVAPAPDLITMSVREAFDPENVVSAPSIFAEYMQYHGFSREWSDRYWTMHFLPIALRQGYENLWRGLWTKDQFMTMLRIADIHPRWREDIYKVAYRAPSTRELGYGFDVGEYSVEDIIEYRRWGGLSEEDAIKAGRSMVAYRTEAEREALRREAMADYVAGLDTEAELRSNLSAIGGRPEIIDLWVSRANYRLERDLILDLVKVARTDYIKGYLDDNAYNQTLITLGIVAERRTVIFKEAQSRKASAAVAIKITKAKALPISRVRKARTLGIKDDQWYIQRMMDHDYTEEDARIDLEIELTPRPITDEEKERRRETVTSRKAKAERRYQRTLERQDNQLDLMALQLTDLRTILSESLDVIDAQISVLELDLPGATPEKVQDINARIDVLLQRRELTEARLNARISDLIVQRSQLEETKALTEKQRDEELWEYDNELKAVEA